MKRADGTKFHRTTPAQIAYIAEHWAMQTCDEIEAAIGVRRQTVKSIASRLKLKKDPETLRAIRARAGGREPGPLSRPRTSDARRRMKTPFGSHLELLLGLRSVELPAASTRVHRILDDELEAA